MIRRLALTLLLLLFVPSGLWAQTVAPFTSYELQIYLAAVDPQVGAPLTVNPIPTSAVTCDLVKSVAPTGTVTNPRFLVWDDPANPTTRECRADRSLFLLALPIGTGYRGTVTGLYVGGVTPRSNTSNPFGVSPVPPVALAGVGFRP